MSNNKISSQTNSDPAQQKTTRSTLRYSRISRHKLYPLSMRQTKLNSFQQITLHRHKKYRLLLCPHLQVPQYLPLHNFCSTNKACRMSTLCQREEPHSRSLKFSRSATAYSKCRSTPISTKLLGHLARCNSQVSKEPFSQGIILTRRHRWLFSKTSVEKKKNSFILRVKPSKITLSRRTLKKWLGLCLRSAHRIRAKMACSRISIRVTLCANLNNRIVTDSNLLQALRMTKLRCGFPHFHPCPRQQALNNLAQARGNRTCWLHR